MKVEDLFDASQQAIVTELQRRDASERSAGIREPDSLMALAPAVARLLQLLVLQTDSRSIAEFGTSHGYSTIHLAAAADRTGGHVHSVDALAAKTETAQRNLDAAGLGHRVTLTTADGAAFVDRLPESIDFVLVDYDIPSFEPAWDGLRPRVAPGGTIFVDGGPEGYWEHETVRPFRERLEADPDFVVSIWPMHKDQLVAVRLRE